MCASSLVEEYRLDGIMDVLDKAQMVVSEVINTRIPGTFSDGYHTFDELYRYRMLYNAAFFNLLPKTMVYKSRKHHDGEPCYGGGWFIVMANLPTGQISNHYEEKYWDLFSIPEKEKADQWDGHTPQEAADRLEAFLKPKNKEPFWMGEGLLSQLRLLPELEPLEEEELFGYSEEEVKQSMPKWIDNHIKGGTEIQRKVYTQWGLIIAKRYFRIGKYIGRRQKD